MRMSTVKRNRQRVDRQGRKLHGWIQREIGKRLRREEADRMVAPMVGGEVGELNLGPEFTLAPIGVEHFVTEKCRLMPWWVKVWNFWLRLRYPPSYVGDVVVREAWWYKLLKKLAGVIPPRGR